MKRSTPLKRTGFANARTGILSAPSYASVKVEARKAPARKATLKTKQCAVSALDKALWNRMATEIGCVACMKDGRFNDHVSIHHIDGRTKPNCHSLVLPLCAPHHQQDDSDFMERVAVHPHKRTFEKMYGAQLDLLAECMRILGRT